MSEIKNIIRARLAAGDYGGIKSLSEKNPSCIRHLISMTYDRGDVLCWRAIEAIGVVTSGMSADEARKTAQRVLWMMRDESGGNAWSGPDILGEIVMGHPDALSDIIPVIASFNDEGIFREGVLRALGRIAGARPVLAAPHKEMILRHLDFPEPSVRGCAVYALGNIGLEESRARLMEKTDDNGELMFYSGGTLKKITVRDLAFDALRAVDEARLIGRPGGGS